MEIKHSSPSVARPVEHHAGKRRWPWILLIVLGVLVVVGGIIAGLYFYGGTLLNKTNDQTNQSNQSTNQANTPAEPTGTGFTVDEEPDADELVSLVIGRFAEDNQAGQLVLSSADATDSGTLTERKVYTHESTVEESKSDVSVSPNGQFAAILENRLPAGASELTTRESSLWLVDMTTHEEVKVADNAQGALTLPIWTPDSERLIFTEKGEDLTKIENFIVYAVESAVTTKTAFAASEDSAINFNLVKATENDLFAIKITNGSDEPAELGVFSLSDGGEIGADFEKLIDMPESGRWIDVSSDGGAIAIAHGAGPAVGVDDSAPFVLELLDRSTGEIEQLRESTSEKYTSPRFTRDGESLIYGAVSGVWMLELDSGDRTQLVESSEFENISDDIVEVRSISANGEIALIAVPTGPDEFEFHTILTSEELQSHDDLGSVEEPEEGSYGVYGWTI